MEYFLSIYKDYLIEQEKPVEIETFERDFHVSILELVNKSENSICLNYELDFNGTLLKKTIQFYYVSFRSYCQRKLSFQDELSLLKSISKLNEVRKKLDQEELELLNLIYLFTSFFSFSKYEIELYLNYSTTNSYNDSIRKHFNFMKGIDLDFLFTERKFDSINVVVIASYGDGFENFMAKSIEEMKDYGYNNINYSFVSTKDHCSINCAINKLNKPDHIFVIGHGDDKGIFDFRLKNNKILQADSRKMVEIFGDFQVESLSLLSCAHDSFKNIKSDLKCKNFILPNVAGFGFSESIIKSFCFVLNNTNDFKLAFDISQYSTYFTSFEGVTINLID